MDVGIENRGGQRVAGYGEYHREPFTTAT
jgi:hypothetical protein